MTIKKTVFILYFIRTTERGSTKMVSGGNLEWERKNEWLDLNRFM